MDENFIKNVFQTVLAENVQVKVIRDRNSGYVSSFHVVLLPFDFPCIPFHCDTLPPVSTYPFSSSLGMA